MALRMREMGFSHAFALAGGLDAWKHARYPVQPLGREKAAANTENHQPM